MSAARSAVLLGALGVACAATTPGPAPQASTAPNPPATAAAVESSCPTARELTTRAETLVTRGRLRQALRASARARALCPTEIGPPSAALKDAASKLARPAKDPLALMAQGIAAKRAGRAAEGQRLLDRALSALERSTGSAVRIVVPPALGSNPVSLSEDGRFIFSGNSESGESDLFEAGTGRHRGRFRWKNAVVVEHGESVATSRVDGVVELVNLKTGVVERTLPSTNARQPLLQTDSAGDRLVVSGNTLTVWELPSGRRLLEREGSHHSCLSVDGRRIALSNTAGSSVTVFDLEEQKQIAAIDTSGTLEDGKLALSPDGTLLAVGVRTVAGGPSNKVDQFIRVHDTRTKRTTTLAGTAGALVFTRTKPTRLISVSRYGAEVWDLQTRKARKLENHCDWSGVQPATREALCRTDEALSLVDWAGTERRVTALQASPVATASLAASVARLATLHGDGNSERLRVLDMATSALLLDLRVTHKRSVALSPDGSLIALGGEHDGEVRDARDGHVLYTFPEPEDEERSGFLSKGVSVRFRPDGRALAAFSMASVDLMDATTGKRFAHLGPSTAFAFSPDSKRVAHAGIDHVWISDAHTGKPVRDAGTLEQGGAVKMLAFSPDSAHLLVGTFRALREYEVAEARPPRLLWYGEPEGLASTPSGKLAVASGELLRFIEPDGQTHQTTLHAHRVEASRLGLVLAESVHGISVLDERAPSRFVTLQAVPPTYALIARSPTGEIELLDPTARDALGCMVGAIVQPLELCEDELLTTGLVASLHRP